MYVFPIFIHTSGSEGEPNPDAPLILLSLYFSLILLTISMIIYGGICNKKNGKKFFSDDSDSSELGITGLILFGGLGLVFIVAWGLFKMMK